MTTVGIKINYAQIRAKIDKALEKSQPIKRVAYNKAYGLYSRSKKIMLEEFEKHPITAEIEGGIDADNISGTLDGYGNLFSFIGFHEGDEPTQPLRELLNFLTTFKQTVYKNKAWYFKVTIPNKDEIDEATPMPWESGSSWAEGIEHGISGLGEYMAKKWIGGRSGGGLQLKYENNESLTFTPRPYMTEILQHFRNRINNIE